MFQSNGNNAYEFTVYGNDSKNQESAMNNFSFSVLRGGSLESDVGQVVSATNGIQNANLDDLTRNCEGAINGIHLPRQVQAIYSIEGFANYPINITTTPENQDQNYANKFSISIFKNPSGDQEVSINTYSGSISFIPSRVSLECQFNNALPSNGVLNPLFNRCISGFDKTRHAINGEFNDNPQFVIENPGQQALTLSYTLNANNDRIDGTIQGGGYNSLTLDPRSSQTSCSS